MGCGTAAQHRLEIWASRPLMLVLHRPTLVYQSTYKLKNNPVCGERVLDHCLFRWSGLGCTFCCCWATGLLMCQFQSVLPELPSYWCVCTYEEAILGCGLDDDAVAGGCWTAGGAERGPAAVELSWQYGVCESTCQTRGYNCLK